MSRDLTAGMLAQITAALLRPVVFYEGEFATGTVRLWSGVGPVTWNGQTWTGAGDMLGIGAITETADTRAVGLTVSLNGNVTELIAAAITEARQGKSGRVWLGALDAAGAVVADPYLVFSGRLDVPELTDGGAASSIAISYESRLIDLERAPNRRFTHEDQQIDYPGDMGFEFVPFLQDAQLVLNTGAA